MIQNNDPTQPVHRERLLNLADEREGNPQRVDLPREDTVPADSSEMDEEGESTIASGERDS